MFDDIENKHKDLINIAKEYMKTIKDAEHDINHMNDVVEYTKNILSNINSQVDKEVCIIGAYWHDVGRIKIRDGHEEESVNMLVDTMRKMNYKEEFIKRCSDSIEFHKWNMTPKTIEGLVVKDADKIAWIGSRRWEVCLEKRQRLDNIINLLPKLKKEILYFEYSKSVYDEEIVKLVKILYKKIYNNI